MGKILELNLPTHRIVWCRKVVSLLPVPYVAEITLAFVVKAPQVVSSEIRLGIQ